MTGMDNSTARAYVERIGAPWPAAPTPAAWRH